MDWKDPKKRLKELREIKGVMYPIGIDGIAELRTALDIIDPSEKVDFYAERYEGFRLAATEFETFSCYPATD